MRDAAQLSAACSAKAHKLNLVEPAFTIRSTLPAEESCPLHGVYAETRGRHQVCGIPLVLKPRKCRIVPRAIVRKRLTYAVHDVVRLALRKGQQLRFDLGQELRVPRKEHLTTREFALLHIESPTLSRSTGISST